MPGYAQPTVEYIDPYSGEPDSYMVSNDWYQIGGIWYFFRPSGGLAKSRWIETGGEVKQGVQRDGGLLFRTGCADLHCGDSEVGDEGIVITADTMLI